MTIRPKDITIQFFFAIALATAIFVAATARATVEPENVNARTLQVYKGSGIDKYPFRVGYKHESRHPEQPEDRRDKSVENDEIQQAVQTISLILNSQRKATSKLACEEGVARIALHAYGISFGHIAASSNMSDPCLVTFDFTELEGMDDDLADKVFGWSDEMPTIADFIRCALRNRNAPLVFGEIRRMTLANIHHNPALDHHQDTNNEDR